MNPTGLPLDYAAVSEAFTDVETCFYCLGISMASYVSHTGASVSIHAPVRGATHPVHTSNRLWPCFNPRARAGRDRPRPQQHTLRSGFNPRARAGRDMAFPRDCEMISLFQSTRPCGARHSIPEGTDMDLLFQSTRPCGARPIPLDDTIPQITVSIHAPVRGAT